MLDSTTIDLPMPTRISGGGYEPWLETCRKAWGQREIWMPPAAPAHLEKVYLGAFVSGPVPDDAPLTLLVWADRAIRDLKIVPDGLKIDEWGITTKPDIRCNPEFPLRVRLYFERRDTEAAGVHEKEAADGARDQGADRRDAPAHPRAGADLRGSAADRPA